MNSQHSDEIDLKQLFNTILKSKITVIIITTLFTTAGVIYALTAKEQWTSTAHITAPRIAEIIEYAEVRRQLDRIDANSGVDTGGISQGLFSIFLNYASAIDNKKDILANSPYFLSESEKLNTEHDKQLRLDAIVKKQLSISPPEKDSIINYYSVSFSADTPERAQETLQYFLNTVSQQALTLIDTEFQDSLNNGILARQKNLENIEQQLQISRKIHIEALEEAIATAKAAGLEGYSFSQNIEGNTIIELSNSNRLFMLGQKLLNAELQTARTAPLIYPAEYRDTQRRLNELLSVKDYVLPENISMHYSLQPTYPLVRDAPKRALIVLLSGILGLMFSVFYVLLRQSLVTHEEAAPEARNLSPVPSDSEKLSA